MERPGVAFARAQDGAYLAYQAFGVGPIDLLWQDDFFAIVDEWWDSPVDRAIYENLAVSARVILHDRRGTGCSSRDGGPANLETRVSDTLAVMDAAGVQQAVVGGLLEGGASMALLAAMHPERVRALVWSRPVPCAAARPDFPWGVDASYIEREEEITSDWVRELSHAASWSSQPAAAMEGPWSAESYVATLARITRRTCTPDVAKQLNTMWDETDVRGVLSSIQVPTLLLVDRKDSYYDLRTIGEHVASFIPDAVIQLYILADDTGAGVRAMGN